MFVISGGHIDESVQTSGNGYRQRRDDDRQCGQSFADELERDVDAFCVGRRKFDRSEKETNASEKCSTRQFAFFSLKNSKNIPLRVLLVIMDEVFDLKKKNMWFRSRFVSILKGFLTTFMGNSVNRFVFSFRFDSKLKFLFDSDEFRCSFNIGRRQRKSPKKFDVSSERKKFVEKKKKRFSLSPKKRENLWPNDVQAEPNGERDENVRCVTEILCKSKLLGIVSGSLKERRKVFSHRRELF